MLNHEQLEEVKKNSNIVWNALLKNTVEVKPKIWQTREVIVSLPVNVLKLVEDRGEPLTGDFHRLIFPQIEYRNIREEEYRQILLSKAIPAVYNLYSDPDYIYCLSYIRSAVEKYEDPRKEILKHFKKLGDAIEELRKVQKRKFRSPNKNLVFGTSSCYVIDAGAWADTLEIALVRIY